MKLPWIPLGPLKVIEIAGQLFLTGYHSNYLQAGESDDAEMDEAMKLISDITQIPHPTKEKVIYFVLYDISPFTFLILCCLTIILRAATLFSCL